MTPRTCHFSDGCAWPSQYGGPHCDCRRLQLADFTEQQTPAPGSVHLVRCPFVRETYTPPNPDEAERQTWRPGVVWEAFGFDDSAAYADGVGQVVYRVVDIHKLPFPYPARVFFTRSWIDPDGNEFGRSNLRIMALSAFKRRLVAYKFAGSDEGRFVVRKAPSYPAPFDLDDLAKAAE